MNSSHLKLLVIDDEPTVLKKIALILELHGFTVHTASGGVDGLDKARRERPDLILCDVSMPDLDGHAVLERLRRDATTASTPFIFLTARAQAEDLRAGMNLGADDYLLKPVEMQNLLNAIHARIDRVQQLSGPAASSFQLAFKSPKPLEALGITERQAEVLFWVAQGKTNAQVAEILGATEGTVKKHMRNIFDHCGFDNRTTASMKAVEVLGASGG